MSEGYESSIQESSAPASTSGAVTAGAMLRAAREAAGVHIGALAVALKVPVRKLDALECGTLENEAEPVFVRALAASVCRHLKVDSTEILALLPHSSVSPLTRPQGLRSPFQPPQANARMPGQRKWLTAPVLAVLGLIAAAGLVLLWPQSSDVPGAGSATVVETPTAPPAASIAGASPADKTVDAAAGPASGAGGGVAAAASAPASVPLALATPRVASEPVGATPAAAGGAGSGMAAANVAPVAAVASSGAARVTAGPATPGSGSVLRFRARGESWIEVSDATGSSVFRRLLAKDEVADVTGTLPLRVVVGRADVTEVSVRGRAFDLAAVAKENVARFEVAP